MARTRSGTPLVTADELAAALGKPVPCSEQAVIDCADAASTWLVQYLVVVAADGSTLDHSTHTYCRRGALTVAVDMWQAGKAAGGQSLAADFTPGPTLGSALLRRVSGVIGPCRDVGGLIG